MKDKVVLFIKAFVVIFLAFTISNVSRLIIEVFVYDASISFSDVKDLPFLLYGLFSAVLSLVFTAFINILKK